MRFKLLGLFAALALLGACETAPSDSAASSGAGASSATTGGESAGGGAGKMAAPRPGSQEDLIANVGDRVFFDFDKYKLKPEGRAVLEKQAAWLKKHGGVRLVLEGHADERGTREYNLALGERRANATRDYLVSLGVSPSRLKTISYGEERPVALGSNEKAWSQNRRAVSVVSGAGS